MTIVSKNRKAAAVITGAAGDLGRALCTSFLGDGMTVYAADIREVTPENNLIPVQANVTDHQAMLALATRIAQEKDLRLWINCAGIFASASVSKAEEELWHKMIAVNLTGTFNGCAAALSAMKQQGYGRIINIGSISGQLGGIGVHPAYGASKGGIHALTKTYALEGSKYGIYCNAVAPGLLDGDMMQQLNEAQRNSVIQACPLKRLGQIDEVVHAVRYLADERASFVNGVILPLNGGAYMPS